MHDTETGRDYRAQRQGSIDPDNCPHACLERTGRHRDGQAVIDLDCVDCGTEGVHEDVRNKIVDRGRGVATDGGQYIHPKSLGSWFAGSDGRVKLGSGVTRKVGADRGDTVLVSWDGEVRVHADADAFDGNGLKSTMVTVGHESRISLPMDACRELGIEPGDQIRAKADGDDVVIEEVDA